MPAGIHVTFKLHMKPESMDAVFAALAHAGRRRMLDILRHNPGCTVGEVCSAFAISRIAVLKHLRVLEDANLLVSQRQGRERRLYLNLVPIQLIHERWSSEYSAFWASQLTAIKHRVEQGEPGRSKSGSSKSGGKPARSARQRRGRSAARKVRRS
jgi:DNA-binding transcriptional ArsR family regulator